MPISSFAAHDDWTSVDHVDRRLSRDCSAPSAVAGEWRGSRPVAAAGASGARSMCDVTSTLFGEQTTFVDESFYSHQHWTADGCRSGVHHIMHIAP